MTPPLLLNSHPSSTDSGLLLDITPASAGWEFVHFAVRRLGAGEQLHVETRDEECAIVLLCGSAQVRIDRRAPETLGPRRSVFEGYPHAVYLPDGHEVLLAAAEVTEIAVCRAPSTAALEPRLVGPADCGFEIRGGGNATRQIVDILPPSFPADKLLICEVFTPGGNWSSYPPHKHDVDNPPLEVDLEEIYYYRMNQPDGYGLQRLYTADGSRDETVKVEDGDVVLVRDGYHPYVSAYGVDSYYLNVLAGTRRSMAASDDPRYAALRASWPAPDPRMPMIAKP